MSGELGKCTVCGRDAIALYPLLPREPKFCNEHHNPRDAGPFGCDFTGPDDFDIPFDNFDRPFSDEFYLDRDTFAWKDKEGVKHPLHTIDDQYLQNIINFLKRKEPTYIRQSIIDFLEGEQGIRQVAERR